MLFAQHELGAIGPALCRCALGSPPRRDAAAMGQLVEIQA